MLIQVAYILLFFSVATEKLTSCPGANKVPIGGKIPSAPGSYPGSGHAVLRKQKKIPVCLPPGRADYADKTGFFQAPDVIAHHFGADGEFIGQLLPGVDNVKISKLIHISVFPGQGSPIQQNGIDQNCGSRKIQFQ